MSGIRDGAAVRRRRRGAAPAGGPSPHAWTAFHGKVVDVPVLVSCLGPNVRTRRTEIIFHGGAADNGCRIEAAHVPRGTRRG